MQTFCSRANPWGLSMQFTYTPVLSAIRRVFCLTTLVYGLTFTAFVFTPLLATAANDSSVPEEIFVTARKRSETVQDVPATVNVFTESDIERSNITRAGDIALLTPGVSLVDAAEVGDTQVNIRGMNGARDAENNYALVVDGITYTNPAALNREYANLQQIEVLKGPQGAIYGRNASAGAFIITTRLPDGEPEGEIKASAGQDDTYNVTGNYGGRISDNLLGSLQAEYFKTDGFYTNEFLNRDDVTDNQELWAVGGRLMWEISDTTTLDGKVRYGEVDAASLTFNSVFHVPFFAQAFGLLAFNEDVNAHPNRYFNNIIHTNDQESTELSVKLDHDMGWASLTAWGLYSDIDNQLGADGTSAAFGFFNTDSVCRDTTLAVGDLGENVPVNPPQLIGGNPDFVDATNNPQGSIFGAYTPTTCDGTQFQRRNQQDYSFEVRLASNSDGPLQWMGGLYFLTIEREVAVNTGVDRINPPTYRGGTVIQQPFTTDPSNATEQLVWDRFDTDVYSIFGQIGYDFSDTLAGDLALRYDKEDRKVRNLVPTVAEGGISQFINSCDPSLGLTPGVDTPLNPGLCGGPVEPKNRDFSEWQPKLSLKWDALESTTLFASWGVGFRSGGFNNQGSQATVDTFINNFLLNASGGNGLCDPATAGCIESGRSRVGIRDDYEKETSSAFELGFKSGIADKALRLEGALYYTKVDDMQFFEFIVGPFGLLRIVENIDEVEVKGIELSATWDAAEWLDLYLGGNWNDTEIKSNSVRPDTVGNESPYTPEYTANLGAYLSFPLRDGLKYFANVNVAAIGKTWFHLVQSQTRPIGFEAAAVGLPISPGDYSTTRRDAYTLTQLRTGISSESWTAALWVDNLFNEDYLEEIIPAPEFGGTFVSPGGEQRVGIDVSYRF